MVVNSPWWSEKLRGKVVNRDQWTTCFMHHFLCMDSHRSFVVNQVVSTPQSSRIEYVYFFLSFVIGLCSIESELNSGRSILFVMFGLGKDSNSGAHSTIRRHFDLSELYTTQRCHFDLRSLLPCGSISRLVLFL